MNFPWHPILITLQLATITTVLLVLISTPLSWWLARTRSRFKQLVEVFVAMPLVLPPTVLGFYLLLLLSPDGLVGQLWSTMGLGNIIFSFSGLVVGSCVYSLPFVVQPLATSFSSVNQRYLSQAALLGANVKEQFWQVALPLSRRGFIVASTLGFAHTLGEFGVVLMIGGNIPSETRVMSIAIFEQVEQGNYSLAHYYSAILVVIAVLVLGLTYSQNTNNKFAIGH